MIMALPDALSMEINEGVALHTGDAMRRKVLRHSLRWENASLQRLSFFQQAFETNHCEYHKSLQVESCTHGLVFSLG